MEELSPSLNPQAWTDAVTDGAVLVADGHNVKVTVRDGHLSIEDGVPGRIRQRKLARVPHRVTRVVILARRGYITLEALRWMSDTGVSVTHIADGVTMTSGSHDGDWRLARAQLDNPLPIARYLTGEKILGQANTLHWWLGDNPVSKQLMSMVNAMHAYQRLPVAFLRSTEGMAARLYWAVWKDRVRVPWSPAELVRVPAHWRVYPGRPTLVMDWETNRHATDPVNAMLNYVYKVLESETMHACRMYGLHPDYGVMHVGGTDRHAFLLDLMEPVRPFCDHLILRFLDRSLLTHDGRVTYFDRKWCHEIRDGQCVLDPPLTHVLAGWSADIGAKVGEYAGQVKRMLQNR